MISGSLYTASQGGIAGRQEKPAFGDGQDLAIGGANRFWRRAGDEGLVGVGAPVSFVSKTG
jgi:hypothetical protein